MIDKDKIKSFAGSAGDFVKEHRSVPGKGRVRSFFKKHWKKVLVVFMALAVLGLVVEALKPELEVPDLTGKTVSEAEKIVTSTSYGWDMQVRAKDGSKADEGDEKDPVIVEQKPKAGTKSKDKVEVIVFVDTFKSKAQLDKEAADKAEKEAKKAEKEAKKAKKEAEEAEIKARAEAKAKEEAQTTSGGIDFLKAQQLCGMAWENELQKENPGLKVKHRLHVGAKSGRFIPEDDLWSVQVQVDVGNASYMATCGVSGSWENPKIKMGITY